MNLTRECVEEALAAGHPLRLLEPASGAGSMVLAVAEHLQEGGFDLSKSLFATLVDIDPMCVQMGFLQLSFKNVPAACVHGNSLLPIEEYSFAYTIAGAQQRGLPVWAFTSCHPTASKSSTRRSSLSPTLRRSHPSLCNAGGTRSTDGACPHALTSQGRLEHAHSPGDPGRGGADRAVLAATLRAQRLACRIGEP